MTSEVRPVTPPPPPSCPVQLQQQGTAQKPKSLMESILVAKMEQVSIGGNRALIRTNSVDSTSSMGSVTSTTSDVCRCDDCLLGIADLYAEIGDEKQPNKKKVSCHPQYTNNPSWNLWPVKPDDVLLTKSPVEIHFPLKNILRLY